MLGVEISESAGQMQGAVKFQRREEIISVQQAIWSSRLTNAPLSEHPAYTGLRNNRPESIWMWVGPTPVPNAAKAWHRDYHGITDHRSLSFDRHSPTTAIGQLEYTIPWSPVYVHVYASMQRGNTWVAKRSISYNMYSYILRRHTRHPVELLRGEQCATVDKDVLTLASGRNILIVLVLLAPFSAGDRQIS